jgi:hypothetical protein
VKEVLRVELEEGKYTVVQFENGAAVALRYGEPWRTLTGDKLVLALAQEVAELRAEKEGRGSGVHARASR